MPQMLSKCSPNEKLPAAHFFTPNGLNKRSSHATGVLWELKNVQQVAFRLGYISRAFEALSSQINEDINKKTDFASN